MFIQSLVYCRLSSTKRMIVFLIIFLLGLVMVQPLSSFSKVDIIDILMSTHSVLDDSAPCPEPWMGSCVVYW